jgi:hypothetical protein
MMALRYLPVSMCWAFLFGERIATAQIIEMGGYGRVFQTRDEAVWVANALRLNVAQDGRVSVQEQEQAQAG